MTLDQILQTKTLNQWCNQFNWQGGTIHQVKEELHSRLIKRCSFDWEQYSAVILSNNSICFL